MKKLGIGLLAMGCLLLFVRCDKIEGPYLEKGASVSVDTPYFAIKTDFLRKIILEEFTGHTCNNCPKGHAIMHDLQESMGDTLLCMAIHSGPQAAPSKEPFMSDFRTESGDNWNAYFSVSNYPSGMINRQIMSNGKRVQVYTLWKKVLDTLSRTEPEIGLQIRDTALASISDTDYVFVKVSFLKQTSRQLRLYVVLLEDSIVSPQLNGTQVDTNYVHNHMLRTNISPLQGSVLSAGEVLEKGASTIRAYPIFRQPAWRWKHCAVLAFVCDAETEEVLQAEEMRCQ
ncbi:MAG: Omp28-related outer membrane protein [Bacteroidales bacterium]|nr:Omp28-related outer membrane protein [Bacteroidales bacterium]